MLDASRPKNTAASAVPATLYIIAAPSGAGKTSLVKAVVDATPGLMVSVSHTTRPMRPGEQQDVHYHFVDQPTFQSMIAAGVFLEHAKVFDNYYGTSISAVQDTLRHGVDVILEIDWQGARQVKSQMPDCVGIFILPPSRATLDQRLRARGQDGEDVIARRMRDAVNEMGHYADFDYLIVNDDFDTARKDMQAIIRARRLGIKAQTVRLHALLEQLLK
jgi:guanylate kinase